MKFEHLTQTKMRTAFIVLTFAGGACSNSSLHLGWGTVAPYHHVILPVKNNIAEEEHTLETQMKNNPNSFQTPASLAALYTSEAKLTGDFDRFDQAEALAKHSLALFKVNNDRPVLVLADIAQARHEFSRAIALAEPIVTHPASKRQAKMEALSLLITAELATGQLDQAHQKADLLVDMDPSVANHLLRALVEEIEGRDENVLYDYRASYQKETFGNLTESAKLRAFWGRFYFRRGEYAKAEGLFREALRILPGDSLTTGFLADLELRQKNFEEANRDYQKAFSGTKSTLYLLGQINAKRGLNQTQGAYELRNQVEKLLRNSLANVTGPNRYAHRNELVKILLERGGNADLREALSLAKEELVNRRNHETLFLVADAQARLGYLPEAEEAIEEILRTGIKDAEYFAFASKLATLHHDPLRAKFYAEQTKRTDPHFNFNSINLQREANRVAVK